jgi:hypothetical protein
MACLVILRHRSSQETSGCYPPTLLLLLLLPLFIADRSQNTNKLKSALELYMAPKTFWRDPKEEPPQCTIFIHRQRSRRQLTTTAGSSVCGATQDHHLTYTLVQPKLLSILNPTTRHHHTYRNYRQRSEYNHREEPPTARGRFRRSF